MSCKVHDVRKLGPLLAVEKRRSLEYEICRGVTAAAAARGQRQPTVINTLVHPEDVQGTTLIARMVVVRTHGAQLSGCAIGCRAAKIVAFIFSGGHRRGLARAAPLYGHLTPPVCQAQHIRVSPTQAAAVEEK